MFTESNLEFIKLFVETRDRISGKESDIAVGRIKGEIIYHLCNYAKMLKGEAAEIGVWRGGSARFIAKILHDRPVRLFDTFLGIPYVNALDVGFEKHDFEMQGLLDQVRRTLKDCPNVDIRVGVFPQTSTDLGKNSYAFVHADADVYQSTRDICEYFYPRLVVGGVLLFDDYGYEGAVGCKKAVDDFFQFKIESPSVLSTGQALIVKSYERT